MSWRLKQASLIKIHLLSVISIGIDVVVNISYFHIFPKSQWTNFNFFSKVSQIFVVEIDQLYIGNSLDIQNLCYQSSPWSSFF